MILTKKEIKKAIKENQIKITPFNPRQIGAASYDLTLDNKFRIFKKVKIVKLDENIDKISKVIKSKKYILQPGEFIHGITKEKITLSNNLCGFLSGRSRYGRKGITIDITAFFVQPGVNNKQVLEIKNVSHNPIELKTETKICQIIFQECKGKAKYNGKWSEQDKI